MVWNKEFFKMNFSQNIKIKFKELTINFLTMKTPVVQILIFVLFISLQPLFAQLGKAPASKLSEALAQKQIVHSLNVWELEELKSENKFILFLEAVQYSSPNIPEQLKGIRLTFISETVVSENSLAKNSKVLEAFIDASEYSELMVALNQMLIEFKKGEKSAQKGEMYYTTLSGIRFGFLKTVKKNAAILSLQFSDAEVVAEFSGTEKFLTEMKQFIDIASKDLYLPENIEKMKNVKKSNQEAKDVIIDDI